MGFLEEYKIKFWKFSAQMTSSSHNPNTMQSNQTADTDMTMDNITAEN